MSRVWKTEKVRRAESKDKPDPYSRVQYRKVVAWPKRIEREAPFLRRVGSGRLPALMLDLGCATGEHSRFFAAEGFRVIGVDRSEAMIGQAFAAYGGLNPAFLVSDLRHLPVPSGTAGFALCLGNTLVHLTEDEDLQAVAAEVGRVLAPGGALLVQILNYQRIFAKEVRYLPLNIVQESEGETVFLRLMTLLPEKRVRFYPTTLRVQPQADPAIEVVSSREVNLRGWTRDDLEPVFKVADMTVQGVWGDMAGSPFEPLESSDLVLLLGR